MKRSLLLFVMIFFHATVAFADVTDELIVGVKPAPPFIEVDDQGNITGFSADLIREVVRHLDMPMTIRFHADPDIPSHLESIREGRIDLGIAATTLTAEREAFLESSVPFYNADLAILVAGQKTKIEILMGFLLSQDFLMILSGLLGFVFLIGNMIWFAEREGNFSENYFHGVIQGMWWAVTSLTNVGYKDIYLKKSSGRLVGIFAVLTGLVLLCVAIASLTSMLTVQQLRHIIAGPQDLYHHTIAVVENTNTVTVLNRKGLAWKNQKRVKNLGEALSLLRKGEVEAVVHDRPMLRHLIPERKEGAVYRSGSGICPGLLRNPFSGGKSPSETDQYRTAPGNGKRRRLLLLQTPAKVVRTLIYSRRYYVVREFSINKLPAGGYMSAFSAGT